MEKETKINIKAFIQIVKRRRWALIVPALAVFSIAVAIAFILPSVYRSTSTILIEEQEISRDYVMATVTSYAVQRLQSINQRIMSSSRLIEIMNRFNLYAEDRKHMPIEAVVENMRDDIQFAPITADVMDSRTGQQTAATIAFSVSYEGENPSIVQQIANVLASLYLEENIRVVGQQTESTSKFLEEEMKAVQTELAELEKKIASYKQSHNFVLPELYQLNRQILDRTEEEIDQMNDQLRTLRDKETYMRSQLSGISPISVTQDKARLNELRVKLAALRAQYSDAFPDVIKTQEEIATLERRLSAKGSSEVVAQKPDNPAYVSLSADLAAIQSAIQSVNRQIANLVKKRDDYRWRVERAPNVEEGYKNLMVVRDNTKAKYDDLTRKFMEARVASGLEKGQMGERFSLIDPATLPEKPVKPPRLMIILIGFILGIGAGVGTASLQEASDHSARSSEDITKALRFPVLAEIPQIATVGEEQRRRRRLKRTIGAAVLIFVILVLVIHFFVMDLDVLWARIARRLDF